MRRTTIRLGTLAGAAVLVLTAVGSAPAAQSAPGPHTRAGTRSYVSLGDSYSVGQFLPDLVTTANYCGRSTSSYPNQLAREPRFAAVYTHTADVTCGGATIDNDFGGILRPQKGFGGPPAPVPADPPEMPAQIDALNAGTGLATVGIGANTYLISEVGTECARLGALAAGRGTPCTDHYTSPFGLLDLHRRTTRLQQQLDRMLPALHDKAPHARFVFVGYPTVFPHNGDHCTYGSLLQGATIAPADMAFLAGQMDHINQVIRSAVEGYGDTFVDTAASSRGHDFCRSGADKWMFGATGDGVGANGRPFRLTVFHPDGHGAANQTAQVTHAIRRLGLIG